MTKEFKAAMTSLLNTEYSRLVKDEPFYFKHVTDDMSDDEALLMLIDRAYNGGFRDGRCS